MDDSTKNESLLGEYYTPDAMRVFVEWEVISCKYLVSATCRDYDNVKLPAELGVPFESSRSIRLCTQQEAMNYLTSVEAQPAPKHEIEVDFETLKGKTFQTVKRWEYNSGWGVQDAIFFRSDDELYVLTHERDCSEDVYIESIEGDIESLLPNQEILLAEERTQNGGASDDGTSTWSFFTIRTMHDTFIICFYGESNGYYREDAKLYRFEDVRTVPPEVDIIISNNKTWIVEELLRVLRQEGLLD